jgi:hypothetical protein
MLKKLLPLFCVTPVLTGINNELEFRHSNNIRDLEQNSTIDNCDIDSYTQLIAHIIPFTYQAIIEDREVEPGRQWGIFNGNIIDATVSKGKCNENTCRLSDEQHELLSNTLKEGCLSNPRMTPIFHWAVALHSKGKPEDKIKETKCFKATMIDSKDDCTLDEKNCVFLENALGIPFFRCVDDEERTLEVSSEGQKNNY